MLVYSNFRYSHHYYIIKCAGWTCFSQFDMTIYHVPENTILSLMLCHIIQNLL